MRLLFVHAHPDDESIATGVAIGAYAAAGHEVHVLTCTLGEQGEVIPPGLAHLDADHDDALGPYRIGELSAALAELGATGHILGADSSRLSAYRDSGMAGSPSAARPDAFVNADPAEAIALMTVVLDAIDPQIVVTYDNRGGYDHPDHVQAHRIACAAVAIRARRPRMYAALTPRSWVTQDRAAVRELLAGTGQGAGVAGAGAGADPALSQGIVIPPLDAPFIAAMVPDEWVSVRIEDPEGGRRREAAMRAHPTQITVHDGWYTLSNLVAARLSAREGYAPLDPATGLLLPGAPATEFAR